jgi:hypothetical protein
MRENVPPDLVDAYDRIIAAGMKFMFDESTSEDVIGFLRQEGPLVEKLSGGVFYLMMNIIKQASGAFPEELIIPAGIDLILQAAEIVEQTGIDQVTPEIIANAVQKYVFLVAEKAGVPQEKVMGGIDKLSGMVQGQGQQPAPQQPAPQGGLISQGA